MQALWSANTSVAHCDAGAMDGGVHLITHHFLVDVSALNASKPDHS